MASISINSRRVVYYVGGGLKVESDAPFVGGDVQAGAQELRVIRTAAELTSHRDMLLDLYQSCSD
jgi:hypothetical protein